MTTSMTVHLQQGVLPASVVVDEELEVEVDAVGRQRLLPST